MSGRDVIGIAQTGTGKTAAFALPILHRLTANPRSAERKSCRVLVLSPTRELSGQILDNFRAYGRHLRVRSALAIGGVPMGGQVRALFDEVLARTSALAYAGPPAYLRSNFQRGVKRLPVAWTAPGAGPSMRS